MNVSIELDDEQVIEIIGRELTHARNNLIRELLDRKNEQGIAIFENNLEDDVDMIEHHIDALGLILRYYGHRVED